LLAPDSMAHTADVVVVVIGPGKILQMLVLETPASAVDDNNSLNFKAPLMVKHPATLLEAVELEINPAVVSEKPTKLAATSHSSTLSMVW